MESVFKVVMMGLSLLLEHVVRGRWFASPAFGSRWTGEMIDIFVERTIRPGPSRLDPAELRTGDQPTKSRRGNHPHGTNPD